MKTVAPELMPWFSGIWVPLKQRQSEANETDGNNRGLIPTYKTHLFLGANIFGGEDASHTRAVGVRESRSSDLESNSPRYQCEPGPLGFIAQVMATNGAFHELLRVGPGWVGRWAGARFILKHCQEKLGARKQQCSHCNKW